MSVLPALKLVRGVIAAEAQRVALGVYVWWKEPGNWYATLYPVAMLPDSDDDPAWEDEQIGIKLWRATVSVDAKPPRPLTLGCYDKQVALPGWSSTAEACDAPDPVAQLDLAWLRANGRPDPAATKRILTWLDGVIAHAGDRGLIKMNFEQSALPRDLTWATVDGFRVSW